jgi:predicted nucleotidyltransferase component of viral defense system
MISLEELKRLADENNVDLAYIERDYALGWFLAGLFNNEFLKRTLVFKGGTALHKIYFPEFRFSVDLDFTLREVVEESGLRENLSSVCVWCYEKSGIEFSLVNLKRTREVKGEEAFEGKVSFVGPRAQRTVPQRIKLDFTLFEKIMLPPVKLPIIHSYSDNLKGGAFVYQLEEIVAEKLRTLLQRTQPRDFYDVWYVLTQEEKKIDKEKIRKVFLQKCEYKGVEVKDWKKFFQSAKVVGLTRHFEDSLKRQLPSVPPFDLVRKDLQKILVKMF